nr:VapE domain-containing protein [uncultured Acetatifactor sp.]
MTVKDYALRYAAMGMRVFPVKRGTKGAAGGQLLRSWKTEATTDPATISGWWDTWPDADVCIATGNDLAVIDLDVKGKEDGTASLLGWIADNGTLPPTASVMTGSGGQHHYYLVDGTYQNRRGLLPGIDIRCDGGYVVAPPSAGYSWMNSLPIARADQRVYDFLEGREKPGPFVLPGAVAEGGRNDTLFKYAASLQAKGLADDAIRQEVEKANQERCMPPLDDKDVETIIRSVLGRYQKGRAGEPDFPDVKLLKDGSTRILVTAANTAAMLEHEGYEAYYDVIRRETVVKRKGETVTGVPQIRYESMLTHITDQYTRYGARASNARIHEHVGQIADANRYNAARQYLEVNYMIYGGCRGIDDLVAALTVKDGSGLGQALIRKWLCQCVAMAHNEQGAYGADGVLVLKGPQGIGKTTFFRKCCSIGMRSFTEGAFFDGSKDKVMANTSAWITELGELPRSMKDSDAMKAFITSTTDKYRAPYDKKEDEHPRFTSFGATTNDDSFLKDDKNRRYWTIDVERIDLDALNAVSFEKVWAEAYEEFRRHGQESFRLTAEERERMDMANEAYRVVSEEERLIRDLFDWEQPVEEWKEYTASQIAEMIGHNVSAVRVGKAMKNLLSNSPQPRIECRIKHGISVYLMPKRKSYIF